MFKKIQVVVLAVALSLVFVLPAFADGPNFGEAIYADGEAWGTKGTADLPAPTDDNRQAYDGLFKFVGDVAEGQLAVAEAAPGNAHYNGGRWIEYEVEWNVTPELVTSYAQLHQLIDDGDVSFVRETGNYFQCPLLPVK